MKQVLTAKGVRLSARKLTAIVIEKGLGTEQALNAGRDGMSIDDVCRQVAVMLELMDMVLHIVVLFGWANQRVLNQK